jgi:hypothetical protein
MPTEAYALCQIVPHVTEKGYIPVGAGFSDGQLLASIVGEPAPTKIAVARPDMI